MLNWKSSKVEEEDPMLKSSKVEETSKVEEEDPMLKSSKVEEEDPIQNGGKSNSEGEESPNLWSRNVRVIGSIPKPRKVMDKFLNMYHVDNVDFGGDAIPLHAPLSTSKIIPKSLDPSYFPVKSFWGAASPRNPEAVDVSKSLKIPKSTHVEAPKSPLTHGKRPEVMEDFISDINNSSGETAYFVSKIWLFTLRDHEREEIISVLWKTGYFEVYQTRTTMFYERAGIELLFNPPLRRSIPEWGKTKLRSDASIGSVNVTGKTRGPCEEFPTKVVFARRAYFRATAAKLTGLEEPPAQPVRPQPERPLSNAVSIDVDLDSHNPPARPNEPCHLGSSSSLLGETSRTSDDEKFMSLRTAVKDRSRYSYSISTHWLSLLSDHQKEDLESVLFKAGYTQLYKTRTTAYFERIRGHAPDKPTNQRESASTEKHNVLSLTERSNEIQRRGDFVPDGMQDFNFDNTDTTNATEPSQKTEKKCVCPPQLLTVSCKPGSSSPVGPDLWSSHRGSSNRTTREPVGDSYVTMPENREGHIISTSVDKGITMKTINFTEAVGYSEVIVSLNVNVETSLSCCLRSDHNNKKVRIEFLKIGGAIKVEEPNNKKTNGLVLKAIRPNLSAWFKTSEEGAKFKEISLKIKKDCSLPQGRRVLEVFRPCDDQGQSKSPQDLVWLELSGIHPQNSGPGSQTLGLECHVKNKLKVDSDESSDAALVLHFKGSPSVKFQGDIYGNSNTFIELNLRFQAEISYCEPCSPLPQSDTPYVRSLRVNKVVEFDCFLEVRTQTFPCDNSVQSHKIQCRDNDT